MTFGELCPTHSQRQQCVRQDKNVSSMPSLCLYHCVCYLLFTQYLAKETVPALPSELPHLSAGGQ